MALSGQSTESPGTIQVARRTVIQGLVLRYFVFIDEAPIGTLWVGQTGKYQVSAGRHEVRLSVAMSTARSDAVTVDVPAGGIRKLRTGGKGWRAWLFLPGDISLTLDA